MNSLHFLFAAFILFAGCIDTGAAEQLYAQSTGKDCGKIVLGHVNPTTETQNQATTECMLAAFDSCTKAKAMMEGTTVEGEKIFEFLEIQGKENNNCKIFRHTASNDSFGQKGNFNYTCTEINRDYIFGSCSSQ